MATELIAINQMGQGDDPRLAVCYARGSSFHRKGKFLQVEQGMRTRVSRALCLLEQFGARCRTCPNYNGTIGLRAGLQR